MAYIQAAADTGYLRIVFYFKDKRVAVSLKKDDTKENRRMAERVRNDVERLVDANNLVELCRRFPQSKPLEKLRVAQEFEATGIQPLTVAEFADQWFKSKVVETKLSTVSAYDSIYEHWIRPCPVRDAEGKIVGRLVDKRLDQFKARDGDQFHQWLASKDGPQSDAMRNKALLQLARILLAARRREYMSNFPLGHLKNFDLDSAADREERAVALAGWTDREAQQLINAAYSFNEQWGAIVEVAFFTGMRRGELFGLQWNDLEFDGPDGPRIHIKRTLRPSMVRPTSRLAERVKELRGEEAIEPGYQHISTPKTVGSGASITMLPRVAQALREQRQRVQLRSVWVFPNDKGNPSHLNGFTRDCWPEIVTRAGVIYRAFEQTRHTFAFMALDYGRADGQTLPWLQGMLRHTNLHMLINHYLKYRSRVPGAPSFLAAAVGSEAVTRGLVWARFGERGVGDGRRLS